MGHRRDKCIERHQDQLATFLPPRPIEGTFRIIGAIIIDDIGVVALRDIVELLSGLYRGWERRLLHVRLGCHLDPAM